jgi:hypothetical protein
MPEEASALRIYIDYDYLAAQQLGDLLIGLHGLFDEILYADAPYLRQLPSAPAARLRIQRIDTGNSVTVYLMQGITQVVKSADPTLVSVTSGTAALAAAGTLILRLLRRAEDLRAKWQHDSRLDEQRKIELAGKRLDLAGKELELRALAESEQNRRMRLADAKAVLDQQTPNRDPQQQEVLAERLAPHLDAIAQLVYDENIRRIEVTLPHEDT